MFDLAATPHEPLHWIMCRLKCLAGQHCQFGPFGAATLVRRCCGESVVRTGDRFRLGLGQGLVARTGVHTCAEQREERSE